MNYSLFSGGKELKDAALLQDFANGGEIGVFESLRTYRGKIFRLEEHLKRFMESARTVGLGSEISKEKIRKELVSAFDAFLKQGPEPDEDFFIRITWWKEKTVVMIGQRKHKASLYEEGIALITSPVKRSLTHAAPAEVKTSAYHNAVLASLEPQSAYEYLFLDRNGFVTEVRIGNFFIIKDGVLLTPPNLGILNGVTRRFVIECAHQLGIPVQETLITRHEVYNADEAFLTNTSWEILPVRELDSRKIGRKIPGPLTSKLHQTFKQKALQECR
jgi:branched-chain amino acid aminotransferase